MFAEKLEENKTRFTFKWNIKNFSAYPLSCKLYFLSPTFTSEILDGSEFQLKLWHVRGSIFLGVQLSNFILRTSVKIKLFSKANDGCEVEKILDFKEGECICAKEHLSLKFNPENLFIPDDTFSVECCIEKISDKTFNEEEWNVITEISAAKCSVQFPLIFPFKTSGLQQFHIPLATGYKNYPNFVIVFNNYHSIENVILKIGMEKSTFLVFATWKLTLKDLEGNVRYLNEGKRFFEANKDNEMLNLENSVPEEGQTPFTCSKKSFFMLNCRLTVSDQSFTSRTESTIYSTSGVVIDQHSLQYGRRIISFKEKLRCLYADRRLCDFTIQVEGEELLVHKTVLGTVSPVFCAMFERNMKEKENSLLMIEDVDADTMQRLIDYAYTEIAADLQWDNAVKLFTAADKYQILELKQKCAEFLSSKLSIENVTDALELADLHQDTNLKKAAEDFAYSNSNEMLKSEKWNVFMENNLKLANIVMREICIKLNDKHRQRF